MKTFRAGNIEALNRDLEKKIGKDFTWREAKEVMERMGNGWRFPTVNEMKYLNNLSLVSDKGAIGNIYDESLYWVYNDKTDKDYTSIFSVLEIYAGGNNTNLGNLNKEAEAYIRPVRDIK